jgi:small GTP-binding protein
MISVGDSGVGKSCLLLRLTNKEFQPTETTIGIEFGSTILQVANKTIKLQIWDTAGQESFRSISRAYYRNAIGCLLVFDVTRRDTFVSIKNWLHDVREHSNESIQILLVANKIDLQRQVSTEEAREVAEKYGLLYMETSAKSGFQVEDAFQILTRRIVQKMGLERDIVEEAEIKRLEQSGVRVGPRKPLVLVESTNTSSCC